MTIEEQDVTARMAAALEEQGGGPAYPPAGPQPGASEESWRREVVRRRTEHDALALQAARQFGPLMDPAPLVHSVVYRDIPVGDDAIAARVYTPHGEGAGRAAVLLFHGGAFWMGGGACGFEINDGLARTLCDLLGAVVLNVDYRLAPEHRYPVQLDDGYAALQWVTEHAAELGIDPRRVIVTGISSGGLLAAGITALARRRGGPQPCLQILISAALDLAALDEADPDDEALAPIRLVRAYYVGEGADLMDPTLSPVRAADLSGTVPSIIITGDRDPLGESGRAYVDRLRAAGVPVVGLDLPMGHTDATPEVRERMLTELVAAAEQLLADGPAGPGNAP